MGDIFEFLAVTWDIIKGVWRLDAQAFETALNAPNSLSIALFVLFFAGVSNTVGHSVILFANRVRRRRFLFSLFIEALVLVGGAYVWGISIHFFAETFFADDQPFETLMTAVALGYAPLLFGFFILLPYLGNIIYQVLRVWVLLAVMVGVSVVYDFGFWEVLITTLLGWLLLMLLIRIPFLRIKKIDDWLWQLSTGTSRQMDAEQAVAQYIDNLENGDPRGDSE